MTIVVSWQHDLICDVVTECPTSWLEKSKSLYMVCKMEPGWLSLFPMSLELIFSSSCGVQDSRHWTHPLLPCPQDWRRRWTDCNQPVVMWLDIYTLPLMYVSCYKFWNIEILYNCYKNKNIQDVGIAEQQRDDNVIQEPMMTLQTLQ